MALSKILGPKTPWEVVDADALRQFLGTVSGKRYLAKMFSLRPRATEKSDAVKRAIQSACQEGYEEFFQMTTTLSDSNRADDAAKSGA